MRLHTTEWGTGERVAVLVHGMQGDARDWWQVAPALAMGHSLGGLVLAGSVARLQPDRAVYVDAPFCLPGPLGPGELATGFEAMKRERTVENLERDRPWWSPGDREAAAAAALRWHVPTAVSVFADVAGRDVTPAAGVPSLVVLADPSDYVPPAEVARLRSLGFTVRTVTGAGHSVWFGHFDAFMAALDGWL
jgi:pimeloyl-ACP methyl ester carboxylesterase